MKVLVTGAAGNGGQAVCRALIQAGFSVRMADVMTPSADDLREIEFVRCLQIMDPQQCSNRRCLESYSDKYSNPRSYNEGLWELLFQTRIPYRPTRPW
ncbi:nucleoside-diphosphate-sugar epimerase [Paenibacillus sp. V4I3]|uniref:hypothetical protein n=1 Tax=Paenibacillus sp. V4I3 TaxID=3042305 RepID=UPI00277F0F6C|nr:hypothetical protein [Paenibacillus sp. V4I3]MDQ0874616.1 nucleoside-diphosphate-sugar epimerase [Paenibacillus sp. V4I3]